MGNIINGLHLRWFLTIDRRPRRRQINRVARLPFSILRMIFGDLRYSMRSALMHISLCRPHASWDTQVVFILLTP